MAQRIINIGQGPNDRNGDPLRTAFDKVNQNFADLFATDAVSNFQVGDETQFVRIELDGEGVPTGAVTIQSGYDTGMPVYIKGGNAGQDGAGGNIIIEAGAPPLAGPQLIEGGAIFVPVGDSMTISTSNSSSGLMEVSLGNDTVNLFAYNGDSLNIAQLILNNSTVNPVAQINVAVNNSYKTWEFDELGVLNLPINGRIKDSNSYLTVENIYIEGSIKDVEGSTGSTGQILSRASNGGVQWINNSGGGANTGDITFSNSSMSAPGGDTMTLLATSGLTDSMELSLGNKQANLYAFNGQNLTQLLLDNSSLHPVAQITVSVNQVYKTWTFDENGVLELPVGGDIVNSNRVTVLDKSVRAVSFWNTATPAQIISPTEDVIMCDTQAAGGTVGFIMPAPGSISVGKTITIKNIHGTNAIYVSGSNTGTVAIETEFGNVGTGAYTTIGANNAFATFIWDGSAWRIINRHGI